MKPSVASDVTIEVKLRDYFSEDFAGCGSVIFEAGPIKPQGQQGFGFKVSGLGFMSSLSQCSVNTGSASGADRSGDVLHGLGSQGRRVIGPRKALNLVRCFSVWLGR